MCTMWEWGDTNRQVRGIWCIHFTVVGSTLDVMWIWQRCDVYVTVTGSTHDSVVTDAQKNKNKAVKWGTIDS